MLQEEQITNEDRFLKSYIPIVDFLAQVLGSNSEIVLNDLRNLDHSIIAIKNNSISDRQLGGPASDLAFQVVKAGKREKRNYIANYQSLSKFNTPLRSSTYFLRYHGRIIGMICINTNENSLNQLAESIEQVLKTYRLPTNDLTANTENEEVKNHNFEHLTDSSADYAETVVKSYLKKIGIRKGFMKPENKIACVRKLYQQGFFQLKDSVENAAQALGASEPSVYRYLQTVKKEEK